MPLTDKHGRKWAFAKDVKVGDMLECDPGFTCMACGAKRCVKREGTRGGFSTLYIDCRDGKHFLEGQIGEDGELVGLYKAR